MNFQAIKYLSLGIWIFTWRAFKSAVLEIFAVVTGADFILVFNNCFNGLKSTTVFSRYFIWNQPDKMITGIEKA